MKKVQVFQFSFSLTAREIVSALGAPSLKGSYSTTKQREWQSLSFKHRYCHCDFQIITIRWCAIKNETVSSYFLLLTFSSGFKTSAIFEHGNMLKFFLLTWITFCLWGIIAQFVSRYFTLQKIESKENEEKWKETETWAPWLILSWLIQS